MVALFLAPGVLSPAVVRGVPWVVRIVATFWRSHPPLSRVSIALLCTGFLVGWLVQALFRCALDGASACVLEALRGVAVAFAPRAVESMFRWRVPFGGPCVVSAAGAPMLHLAEFWCLWWHRVLVLERSDFVLSGALVHCVVPWVAPGACDSTVCCTVCLLVRFVRRFSSCSVLEELGFPPLGHVG
ncbi:hypothetical protein Taro_035891 [Colocasia esculenta]|uniref:Uncharacterized protein n=1 Tax=Colocasia esculenta TaxID=4460 RepID=A0A843WBT6_COLES|nr:hypothetical protein [Colocasia esculenta]